MKLKLSDVEKHEMLRALDEVYGTLCWVAGMVLIYDREKGLEIDQTARRLREIRKEINDENDG